MDPDVETMLTITATGWILAVVILAGVAVHKAYVFGRDEKPHPRLEALKWLSDVSSLIATGLALATVATYWYVRWSLEDGWIYTSVFYLIFAIFVVSAPNRGRAKATKQG